MAVVQPTITQLPGFKDNTHLITWASLHNGDTGAPIEMPGSPDRSIQFGGTFGTGGTIQIEGSNDSTNYLVLTDPQGNNISKTAAAIEQIVELPRLIRPNVTAGDGTTSLNAYLIMKLSR